MRRKTRKSALKPSGYDVVIRNRNRVKDINIRLKKAKGAEEEKLIDEKDLLLKAMWKACPHESVCHADGVKTVFGPDPIPARFCTSCGESELSAAQDFQILGPRKGRTITRLEGDAYRAKLGRTLLWTGINVS